MIDLTFDIVTGIAALVSPVTFKSGGGAASQVPVRVTFSATPGSLGATDIKLAIGTDEIAPSILAYNEAFTSSTATVYLATLDANDSRLVDFMADRGPEPVAADLLIELVVTISSKRMVAPSLACVVEPAILSGPTSTSGGPTYYTAAEVDALLAAAAGGIDTTITSLTGGGAASLNFLTTVPGSGAVAVGSYRTFDVASGAYEGYRVYKLITSTAAESLPGIVRPLDYSGGAGKVWEARL